MLLDIGPNPVSSRGSYFGSSGLVHLDWASILLLMIPHSEFLNAVRHGVCLILTQQIGHNLRVIKWPVHTAHHLLGSLSHFIQPAFLGLYHTLRSYIVLWILESL